MATEIYALMIGGNHEGMPVQNVLHFQTTGASGTDSMGTGKTLVDGWIASLEADWLAMLPGSYYMTSYQTRRVNNSPSQMYHKQYAFGSKVGTRGSIGEALQLCPALFLVPTMGAKSGGKIFLPAVAQGDIISNVIQTALRTAINTFITALLAGFTSAGVTWVNGVFSRKTNTFSPTTAVNTSPVIGYQKRRRAPASSD